MHADNLKFREMKSRLEAVFKEYHKSKMVLDGIMYDKNYYPIVSNIYVKEENSHYLHYEQRLINEIERKQSYQLIVDSIDYALNKLEEPNREIIYRDFIEKSNNWWCDYYSRSTYYRLKAKAMKEILSYLFE